MPWYVSRVRRVSTRLKEGDLREGRSGMPPSGWKRQVRAPTAACEPRRQTTNTRPPRGVSQMAGYQPARRYPVQGLGHRRGRLSGCRAAANSPPLGSFVSSSPCLRSGRQVDSTTAKCRLPAWRTGLRSDGTCGLFARHPFRVRRAALRLLSLGNISSVSAGRVRCLSPSGRGDDSGCRSLLAAMLSRAAAPAKLPLSTAFAKIRMSSERATRPSDS